MLVGRVCGLAMSPWLMLAALAIGFAFVTFVRWLHENRKPPRL
jgi:hypothetical protein